LGPSSADPKEKERSCIAEEKGERRGYMSPGMGHSIKKKKLLFRRRKEKRRPF